MLELITDPLAGSIVRRALAEVILLGAVCGPLGVWVILYRQSYAAESISHGMLPGLVLAALAGLPLGLGAAGGLALAALLIGLAARQELVGSDVAVAVAVTGLFGAGALLALAPAVPVGLGELLFGDPLSVDGTDLVASAALVAVTLGALAGSHRALLLGGFDPQSAGALGGSVRASGLLLLGLLAATTLVAVQALGNLLVVAIIIGPAAAALRLRADLGGALRVAALLAALAGVGGIYLSYYAELAAGASIALVAVVVFGLTLPLGARRRGPRPAGLAQSTSSAAVRSSS